MCPQGVGEKKERKKERKKEIEGRETEKEKNWHQDDATKK